MDRDSITGRGEAGRGTWNNFLSSILEIISIFISMILLLLLLLLFFRIQILERLRLKSMWKFYIVLSCYFNYFVIFLFFVLWKWNNLYFINDILNYKKYKYMNNLLMYILLKKIFFFLFWDHSNEFIHLHIYSCYIVKNS